MDKQQVIQLMDERHENTFPFVPYKLDLVMLECIEQGKPQWLKEWLNQEMIDYQQSVLPQKYRWNEAMCFMSGVCYAFAVKGGLSAERASAISKLYTDIDFSAYSKEQFVQKELEMFMHYASEVQSLQIKLTSNEVINQALQYIDIHIDEKIKIEDVAQHCHYSESGLHHLFSKWMHQSLNQYITQKKIEKACFLLTHTSLSCTAIAQKLSYGSQSYFIQQFSKVMKITPTQYRQSTKHKSKAQ